MTGTGYLFFQGYYCFGNGFRRMLAICSDKLLMMLLCGTFYISLPVQGYNY
jgi:hypothetical protein